MQLLITHLIGYTSLNGCSIGPVTADSTLYALLDWSHHRKRCIDLILETRLKQYRALQHYICGLLHIGPSSEIGPHRRVNNRIELCKSLLITKHPLGQIGTIQPLLSVALLAKSLTQRFTERLTICHQLLCSCIRIIDRHAILSQQTAHRTLTTSDTSCNSNLIHIYIYIMNCIYKDMRTTIDAHN